MQTISLEVDAATMRSHEEEDEALAAAHADEREEEEEEEGDDMLLLSSQQQQQQQFEPEEQEEEDDVDGDEEYEDDESWRFVGVSKGGSGDGTESDHRHIAEYAADDLYHGEYEDGEEEEEEEEEYDEEEEEDDDLVHRSWSTEKEPLSNQLDDLQDAEADEGGEDSREGEYQEIAQYDDASYHHRRLGFLQDGYRDAGGDQNHEGEVCDGEEDEDGSTDEDLLAFQLMQWTSSDKNAEPLQQRGIVAPTQQSMDRVEASVRAALSILNGRDSSSHSDMEHEGSSDQDEEHKDEEHEEESHNGDDQDEWKLGFGDDGKPFYYDIVHEAMEARWPLEFPADAEETAAASAVSADYEAENQREAEEEEEEDKHKCDQDEGGEREEVHEGVYMHGEVVESVREVATEDHEAVDDEEGTYEDEEDQYHEESYRDNNAEESDEEHADDEKEGSRFAVSAASLASHQVQMQQSNFTLSNFSTVTEGEDEWQEAYTAKGRVYYYNRRTRESSWKKPENYVSRQPQKQLAFSSSFSSSRGVDNNSHYNNASFYSSAASVGGRRASHSPETQDFLFCSFCGAKSVGEAVKTHFRECSAQRFHRENQTDLYKKFEELLCLMSEDSTLRSLHFASSFPEVKPLEVSPSALTSYRESSNHASIQDSLLLLRRQRHSGAPQETLNVGTRELEHREAPQERPVHKRERLLVRMSSAPSSGSVRSSESSTSRRKISVGSASEASASTRSNSNSNNASRPKQSTSSGYYQESETCRYCGRSFAEGRLAKHEAVCPRVFGNEGSWGRGMTQASSTTPTASVSPYAKAQRGADFLRKKSRSTPIEKRNLVLSFKEHQATLVGCPVCKRKFAPSGAQQHIDICKSVQNRPRNPIRLMKDFAVAGVVRATGSGVECRQILITMESKDGKPAKTGAGSASGGPAAAANGGDQVDKWWTAISRLVVVQLCCGLLMQLSYVAFPAYNFALALWCLVCCTPKWVSKNPRLLLLHLTAIGFSIVTDIIWTSLWVSDRVFYDQLCGQNGVSIVSCGDASDYYPGCQTNRFALFTLILNDLAKAATLVAMYRVHALTAAASGGNRHTIITTRVRTRSRRTMLRLTTAATPARPLTLSTKPQVVWTHHHRFE